MLKLQSAVKIFLVVIDVHNGYLGSPPTLGLSNAQTLVTIRHIDQKISAENTFLGKKTPFEIPFWISLLYVFIVYRF